MWSFASNITDEGTGLNHRMRRISMRRARQLSPMDMVMIAEFYDEAMHNPTAAAQAYLNAVRSSNPESPQQAQAVLERVTARLNRDATLSIEHQLPAASRGELQLALSMLRMSIQWHTGRFRRPPNQTRRILCNMRGAFQADNRAPARADHPDWKDDPENVHDTAVNTALRHNFELLRQSVDDSNLMSIRTFIEIITSNESDLAHDVRHDAVSLLTYIQSIRALDFIPFECAEVKAVEIMITYLFQSPQLEVLFHNFVLNCADAFNRGEPHCINGRMARLLSSFEFADPGMQPLYTIQAIRNQVFARCAAIREEQLARWGDAVRSKYEQGVEDPDTEALRQGLVEAIEKKIHREFGDSACPPEQLAAIIREACSGC